MLHAKGVKRRKGAKKGVQDFSLSLSQVQSQQQHLVATTQKIPRKMKLLAAQKKLYGYLTFKIGVSIMNPSTPNKRRSVPAAPQA